VVPFKGTPDVVNAIRGGQIHAGLDILSPLLAQIQGKALRPLAVTGAKRSRVLPDVPTAQEAGVKGLNAASWNGLAVPAGTPAGGDRAAEQGRERRAGRRRRAPEAGGAQPRSAPRHAQDAADMLAGDIRRWAT
jgi:hypothetical protein